MSTQTPNPPPQPAPAEAQREISGLVRRAQGGDAAAFEQLYRLHAGRVYALCLRLSGDPERAAGLTQDAFVRAWEKLCLFEGRSAFSTWLHRLTVNLVVEEQRAAARRSDRVIAFEELAAGQEGPPPEPATAAVAEGVPDALDIERAIAALPSGARLVFVLHDVEGYRHQEIAVLTGVTEGTVKSQLHRARRLLREVLER